MERRDIMNYKVVLGIVGVVIIVGAVICFATRDKNDELQPLRSSDDTEEKKTDIAEVVNTEVEDTTNLSDVKDDAAEKMSERHEEAKKVMKESVDNIFNGAESTITKNEETKKKMFDDLDNI